MHGAVEGSEEQRWRRPGRPWSEPRWPQVGDVVGGYRLEARLGAGGQGTVFLARRAGRLYAIKFLSPGLPERAWRELEVWLKLRRVGSMMLWGHGHWPDSEPRLLFLVMPYVHGRPVYTWAREKDRTAYEVVRVLRALVRQLGEIHRAGVVHRDVKGTNVLVRYEDGEPVLVDFGLGTWPGAPEITNPLGLPGTRPYRSPEALRFRRQRAGEHSPARFSDDLWAVGVLLYVLLTGRHPFTSEVPDEGALADVILYEEPEPPHVLNPRVPRALSELCLRLLEKRREARYPEAGALLAELEAVLAEADASWAKGMGVAWSPEETPPPPEVKLPWGERWRLWIGRMAHAWPRLRHAVAGGGTVLALGLVGWLAASHLLPTSPAPEPPATTPPVVSHPTTPEVRKSGQEVASPDKTPEVGGGAAPVRAATPVPVASATTPKDNKRVKTARQVPQPGTKQQRKQDNVFDTAGNACVLVWIAGQLACVTPTTEIRPVPPLPPPAECPPGSRETMKKLGLREWEIHSVEFHLDPYADSEVITVYPGPGIRIRQLGEWKGLPVGTEFSGELFLDEKRLYGRFTRAHLPNGDTLPVCLALSQGPVLGYEKRFDSRWDNARIWSSPEVLVVDQFE